MVTLARRQTGTIPGADHPVVLQGIGRSQPADHPIWGGGTRAPSLCERQDQDFVGGVLAELAAGHLPQGILRPASASEQLMLRQPVHGRFTLALLELACDPYQEPLLQARLSEARVHSAGLVVRRLVKGGYQGWRTQGDPATGQSLRGWIPFLDADEENLDPDPAFRPAKLCGHPNLESRYLPQPSRLSESSSRLFLAPPDVASRTGRTVLYGLVPITSFERSELAAAPLANQVADDEAAAQAEMDAAIVAMLPYFLRLGDARSGPSPSAESRILLRASDLDPDPTQTPRLVDQQTQDIIRAVYQLTFHFRVFDSPVLTRELEGITIDAPGPNSQTLAEFLRQANKVIIERDPHETLSLPVKWGSITPPQYERLLQALKQQIQAQLQVLTAAEGRFEDADQIYAVRAFVRLRSNDGCPPKIIWSDYSNPFTIAPWYFASDGPPLRIELPDVLDPSALRQLKPNVAFRVPPRLFKLLGNKPEDLLKGNDAKIGRAHV